jgi:hypothetical protein
MEKGERKKKPTATTLLPSPLSRLTQAKKGTVAYSGSSSLRGLDPYRRLSILCVYI